MRELVSSFIETSLAEVRRYGGTAQFLGDGFMAVFGAPLTQEDHVQRALLAALGVQQEIGGGGRRDSSGYELELAVRIGIHTGSVAFGPIAGGMGMDHTVIGDTANLAARLQQAAEPATILLSEATYRLAESYVRATPVGPLELKGKPETVLAYRLLEISQSRAALRASTAERRTAFVGRHADRMLLNDYLRRAEDGNRQAVGIVGEPGIGKSRLLAEFRRQLGADRATWLEGRCLSYGTAIPYLPMLDILRDHCGVLESDSREAIAQKIAVGLTRLAMDPEQDGPVLLHLLGIADASGAPPPSNPEAVKAAAFGIFLRLIAKSSLERPLVMVLEDLHWIDRVSDEFLGYLAENTAKARLLIVASYRPGYRPPWIDKSYAGQIPLQPLSRDDSVSVVRSVLRTELLIELVTEEIVAKGDGNPFFLEQLTLHAGEAAGVRSDLMVPDTIHDVVMARIDRLPEVGKRALQTAAVIGREFSSRLLAALWSGPRPVEDQLGELCRLEFMDKRVDSEGAVYTFRHALTQETAYGSLLERQRRAQHAAVGLALEVLYLGRAEEVAELLALHFGRSEEAEKAVDYTILAARKAQRRWANNDALNYFNDALRRLDTLPDSAANRLRRIDAVLDQAEVKYALGRSPEHIEALEKVRGIVEFEHRPGAPGDLALLVGIPARHLGRPPR